MSKFELKLNDEGIQDLLSCAEMQNIISTIASQRANAAGPGYSYRTHVMPGPRRAVANIFPTTKEAAQDNYENNTLLKVVGV